MRISYNWIAELVPGLSLSPSELAELLTRHSFETQVAETFIVDPNILVAKIVRIDAHPNADRLHLAVIDTGGQTITVVCGAPNIQAGNVVPYAPPGTVVFGEEGKIIIQQAKIRGVESPGMLASPRELGLSDSHSGIFILPSDLPIGSHLCDHLPPDTVLEAEVTPNRAHDCLCHLGVAREVAAILNLQVSEPELLPAPDAKLTGWTVAIEDANDAPRYFGALVQGLQVAASPLWLQQRLFAAGIRPINNIVDITNYVLLEQGNPLHAFDAAKLPAKEIQVRRARAGEQVAALDGVTYALKPQHLAITSGGKPVAIAGIMGGAGSEVADDTENIFLEAASFRSYLVQQASVNLRLSTESSRRFSKGLSPVQAGFAARRALALLSDLAGGQVVGTIDQYEPRSKPYVITFQPRRIPATTGTALPDAAGILRRLRFAVTEQSPDEWQVTPPPDRLDIQGPHDVAEEVIRIDGLDKIPQIAVQPAPAQALPLKVQLRDMVRDQLAASGFMEVYNRPFEHERYASAFGLDLAQAVAIANPVAPEQAALRQSLLPKLCETLVLNKGEVRRKNSKDARSIFEFNSVWRQGEGGRVAGVIEEEHVAGIIVDGANVACLLDALSEALAVSLMNLSGICSFGQLKPEAAASLKLPAGLSYFVINLSALLPLISADFSYTPALPPEGIRYQPINRFPAVYRDLSILIAPDVSIERVQEVIERVGGKLVADVDLFDVYENGVDSPPLQGGARGGNGSELKRSLAFHIAYQAPDRTLTSEEVAELHNQIVAELKKELSAELRE